MFKHATRRQSKLRLTIDGPAGSGKSYTALRFAHTLAQGKKIAAIDTERGSLSKYVGENPDGIPWDFDVVELTMFSPEKYTEMIQMAGKLGYAVLIIDSLSHAWEGVGGALEIKDRQGGNQWTAWRNVTPIHNRMVDSVLQSPCHIITTMRSRMEYVQETDEKGKISIRKVGMAPIQRPGMEYEFDLVCDIDWSHILSVSKSRCSAVSDLRMEKPGPSFIQPVMEWLESGDVESPVYAPTVDALHNTTHSTLHNTSPSTSHNSTPSFSLDDFIAKFGTERTMQALAMFTNGALPTTTKEYQDIAAFLQSSDVSVARL